MPTIFSHHKKLKFFLAAFFVVLFTAVSFSFGTSYAKIIFFDKSTDVEQNQASKSASENTVFASISRVLFRSNADDLAPEAVFAVNSNEDSADATPGDRVCADAEGKCTLRAAIQEANAVAGVDTINFNFTDGADSIQLNPNLTPAALTITEGVTINGPGARALRITGNAANSNADVFTVTSAAASTLTRINGLTIEKTGRYGINNAGRLEVANVTVRECKTGIFNTARLIVHQSLVHNNSNSGIRLTDSSQAVGISNTTVTGNSSSDNGGGINTASGDVTLNNVTVTNNFATAAGGGLHYSGQTTGINLRNTIVAANNALNNPDVFAGVGVNFVSRGNNLIGKNAGGNGFANTANNDRVGTLAAAVDPMLDPLLNNGGQTDTHALKTGSPARNTGNPCVTNASCPQSNPIFSLNFDQRGTDIPRIYETAIDMGAFESFFPQAAITSLVPNNWGTGRGAFELTVNGSNFVANSRVKWNGQNKSTTFVSNTQLRANILSSDVSSSGQIPVLVENPAPNPGTSNTVQFTVANCTYSLSPTSQAFPVTGGGGNVDLTTLGGCQWTAQSNASWIAVDNANTSGNGPANIKFTVQPNAGIARTGTITIGGQTFTVTQPNNCSFSISSQNPINLPNTASSTLTFSLTASDASCQSTASTTFPWITLTSSTITGSGSRNIGYSVQANTGTARTGTISIAGQAFTINQGDGCSYTLNPANRSVSNAAGNQNFTVTTGTGCAWTAAVTSANSSWVTITSGASGSGNGTVAYSFTANTGPARQATITVNGQNHTISQEAGCTYSITPSRNFATAGGQGTISVTTPSGCQWTASVTTNSPWVTITNGANGTGNGTVTYSVAANTGDGRTATITVNGQTHTVTQAPNCTFSIAPNSGDFTSAGGNGSFTLTTLAGCPWTASSNVSWITFPNGSTGNGAGTVNFTVAANTSSNARTGLISVGGQTFTVNQQPNCTYSLNAPNLTNVPAAGTLSSVTLNTPAGCTWTATSDSPWLVIDSGSTSGTGTKTIGFTVQRNIGPERTGRLTIGGQIFTVVQINGCTFTVSTPPPPISKDGANLSLSLTASDPGCTWTATTTESWITIRQDTRSGNGSKEIFFSVAPNNGPQRSGSILVGGQTFTITQQNGCTYTLSANSQPPVPSAGGSFSVSVTASNQGCPWTAASNASWITVTSNANNTGNQTVSFTVAPNNGIQRTGTLTIAGQTFTVTQLNGCRFTLTPTSVDNLPSAGGTFTVALETSDPACTWSATTSTPWITINSGSESGTGPRTISYTVLPNTGLERNGSITIGGVVFNVRQLNGCRYTLEPTEASFQAIGGSGSFAVKPNNQGCTWSATTTASWITINSGSGTGDGTVSFTVQENVTPLREGFINIGGQTFKITQANGCRYNLSASNFSAGSGAGNSSFTVNSGAGCQWTVAKDAAWITITSNTTDNGTKPVSFSFAENVGPERLGTITVNGQTFTVRQASGCRYTLSPPSPLSVPIAGGPQTVTVTPTNSQCTWTASVNVDASAWITIVSGGSGTGTQAVVFNVAQNTGPARSGSLTIAGQNYRVDQGNGCTYAITTTTGGALTEIAIDELGGDFPFRVTGSNPACTYTATTSDSWITIVSGGSGTVPGTVNLRIQENPTTEERTGAVTVNGVRITVRQVSLTVRNLNDDGFGSLRRAIVAANNSPRDDVIKFAPGLEGNIILSSGEIKILNRGKLEIQGPGANKLGVSGGGLSRIFYIDDATVTISGLTLLGGNGVGEKSEATEKLGGAVYVNLGSTVFSGVSIVSNDILGNPEESNQNNGGGLYIRFGGTHRIENSTISNNRSIAGGGIFYAGPFDSDGLTIINSTIASNTAHKSGGGITVSGRTRLRNVTITNNTVMQPMQQGGTGAGMQVTGFVDFANTLIASNILSTPQTVGHEITLDELNGSIISRGNNLVGNVPGDSTTTGRIFGYQPTDVLDQDPKISLLTNFGGKSETVALMTGSPAIDKGNNSSDIPLLSTDQRGAPRIINNQVDIGAYEHNVRVTPANSTLPPGSVNVDYFGQQISAIRYAGAADQFSFHIAGDFPDGLKMENGFINGKPAQARTLPYIFFVIARGSDGFAGTNRYEITVGCNLSLSRTGDNLEPSGGTQSFNVIAETGCIWRPTTTDPSWITINTSGSNGNGSVGYTVAPNPGATRNGIIRVNGVTFTVTQSGSGSCSYLLTPPNVSVSAASGGGNFGVNTQSNCNWSATSNQLWLSVLSNSTSGSGAGSVSYTFTANTTGVARTAEITVAGQKHTVTQASPQTARRTAFDFDGDNKADVAVLRPSNNSWYILNSANNGFFGIQFGANGDKLTPADFDGDGKTDVSVFRNGAWYYQSSLNNTFHGFGWGIAGDIPVPGDYDGDGKADYAVVRSGNWYILQSSNNQFRAAQFGFATDVPVQADYDGDGKTDIAVFRDGAWYWLKSSDGAFSGFQFGQLGDKPVAADYDGDGKADQAVFRSGFWYYQGSTVGFIGLQFGISTDLPTPADYDGDGKADVAVFRTGDWYFLNSSNNQFRGIPWGIAEDKPIQGAFIP